MSHSKMRCGFVAIVGQPNVGKSTLLNHLLGTKISITSKKPQTTRHQILGIHTLGETQVIYLDTPGIHLGKHHAMNRYLNRAAIGSFNSADVIVFMVSGLQWNEQDKAVFDTIKKVNRRPTVLVINKVDRIQKKAQLLPHIKKLAALYPFAKIIPLCAYDHQQAKNLENLIVPFLPESDHHFFSDQLTNRNERFIAAEIVREKLTRFLGDELPYATTVTIDHCEEDQKMMKIHAVIWVQKASQKPIVIGKNGLTLKNMATRARMDIEHYVKKKVYLTCWVKVKQDWSHNEILLNQLGYSN